MWTIEYWKWLLLISVAFVLIERIRPWRREQPVLRRGLLTDLLHLALNGYVLALLLAPVAALVTPYVNGLVVPVLGQNHVSLWPLWLQLLIAFFVIDFIKWSIHVMLHSVPWLWTVHKVHHSIVEMDWIGNMRFHWLEIVIYNGVLYVPMLLLGFDFRVLVLMAIISTVIGHFNHSNLKLDLGPLKYVFNHPAMHIWHHDYVMRGRAGCNYGINLSCWDWIFGTVYYPPGLTQPERLAFKKIEDFPKNFFTQQLVPLTLWLGHTGAASGRAEGQSGGDRT